MVDDTRKRQLSHIGSVIVAVANADDSDSGGIGCGDDLAGSVG